VPDNVLSMARTFEADWGLIKTLVIKGVPVKKISEQSGVPVNVIAQRKYRQKWRSEITRANAVITENVITACASTAKGHVNTVIQLLGDHLDGLRSRGVPMKWEDFDTATKILDRLDTIGRRAHGIDNDGAGHGTAGLVQIIIQAPAQGQFRVCDATEGTTLDVNTVPDQTAR